MGWFIIISIFFVLGFEKIGRAVAEVLIESSDVNLVAIYAEEMNATNLVHVAVFFLLNVFLSCDSVPFL